MTENIIIVIGGALFGVVFVYIMFKYCLDSLLYKLSTSHRKENYSYQPIKVSNRKSLFKPEIERFVHEEFDSANHDVVFIVMSNQKSCVGITVFMQDRKVEYFLELFPMCCVKSSEDDSPNILKFRAGLVALSFWGVQFTLAEDVHMLSDNRAFVEMANSKSPSIVMEKISQFEDRYDFKLLVQWTDNYICDMVSLWAEHIYVIN